MSRRFQLFGVLLLLLLIWKGFSQSNRQADEPAYWYKEAEKNYAAENPTGTTDSIALAAYEKAIQLFLPTAPRDAKTGDAIIKRGNIFQGQREYANAQKEYHRAMDWFRSYGADSLLFYQASLHLGSNFYYTYTIDSARYYLEQAARLALNHADYPDQDVLYNSLGALYFQSSNFLQAANYFEKARMLLDPAAPEYRETFHGFSNNIAFCESALGNYEEALSIYRPLLKDAYLKNRVIQNIGHLYYEKNEPDSALRYFQQVVPNPTNATVRMYQEMARIYLDKNQPDQSRGLLDKADSLNRLLGESPREKAVNLLLRSRLLVSNQNYPEALQYLEKAAAGINEDLAPLVLFEIQEQKSDIYLLRHKQTKTTEDLKAGALALLKAIRLASYIRSNYDNDEAKLFFNRSREAIYWKAAEAVYNWYAQTKEQEALESFFELEDAYKGSVLNDQLRQARERTAINPEQSPLLAREVELRQALAYYSSLLNTLTEPAEKQRIEEELVSTKVALSRVQQELNAGFNENSLEDSVNGLSVFQQRLTGKQAVLSFLQTDSVLFRFLIRPGTIQLDRIPVTAVFREKVQHFISSLHSQQEGVRYQGNQDGYYLYQVLLQPLEGELKKLESCTILADGFLHLVPFEALPVTEASSRYLLQDLTISYHLSFDQVYQQRKPAIANGKDSSWMSFAPYAEEDPLIRKTGLAVLPFSASETGKSDSELTIVKSEATKAAFLTLGGSKKILHIASHAAANREGNGDSWIKFYPEQPDSVLGYTLFLPEIYPLPLKNTELVILSACESASGIAASGEGLLSLSRAFLYAGSNGVIASLWKSEDLVTAYLIRKFREGISAGLPVETALQEAKLQLLSDPEIPVQFKQPNYWAHLVYIGNCSPAKSITTIIWWLLAGAGAVVLLVYFLRKRASSSSS